MKIHSMSSLVSKPISSDNQSVPKAWLYVFLLCIVGTLNYLDRTMITTMRGSIIEAIPMTDAQFGLLTSVFLWTYGIFSPFGGFLADRFSRSKVIICSIFIWSVVTWITAYATTFEGLIATRVLMGISEACYMPAALALITDFHGTRTRSLAIGLHMTGIIAGQSFGFVGGWMAELHTWNYAFYVFGIAGVIYSVFLAFILKDRPVIYSQSINAQPIEKVRFVDAIINLFSRRAFIIALCFWGLLGIVGWLIMGWLPTYYKERFNLSQSVAGLYATGYLYPFSMIGVLVGGFLADRWSRTNPRARIILPAIGLLVAAPGIFIAINTEIVTVAIGGFILYAFTKAFSDANMMPILCLISDSRYRATGYGILNLFGCIIGGIGLYAGGILRDSNINLSNMFLFAAASMIVCAVLLLMIKTQNKTNEDDL
jgi:MFS family permease